MNLNLLLANELNVLPAPLGFESWTSFWMIMIVAAINAVLLTLAGYKLVQVIQLSGYKVKGLFAWFKETKFAFWGKLIMLAFLSSAALLMTNVLLSDFFKYKIMEYIGLIFYLVFAIVFILNVFSVQQKTPLKYTKRVWRFTAVNFIIIFGLTLALVGFSEVNIPYFKYGAVGITPALLPLIVILSHYICYPFEALNNKRFVKKAKKKLEAQPNLIKIGITGSYGKTSVKNILATILSSKYKVCETPFSYNTPLGLSKTILSSLSSDDEVFIAEMGAKNVGDIAELCDMVKPNIALITGIGNQHMATFASRENLIKTKSEITLGMADGGKLFVNIDSAGAEEIYNAAKCKKIKTSYAKGKSQVFVTDETVDEKGSAFTLHIGKETIKCQTSLLGAHNISNIILAVTVAKELGLSVKEIASGIEKLVPTSHRLAIVPSSNSLIVIDDAYNGSVEGTKAALDVLSKFKGKKVVITPGLVELGNEQFNSNFEFGKDMARVADYVIINGITNYDSLSSGLIFGGFDESHILRSGSLAQAVTLLSKITDPGDVVLFENDLPDNYA